MTGTLKQYAIDRVLTNADSELYRYVSAGDAVPVAVLESEFKPLLESFDNAKASAFEQDYQPFLTEDAKLEPVVLVPMGDPSERRFKAGGSIDTGLAKAIEQVHGVAPEALATQLVERTMHTINPDHIVRVSNLSITEQLEALDAKLDNVKPIEDDNYYESLEGNEPLEIGGDEAFETGYGDLPEDPFEEYTAGQDAPTELPMDEEVFTPKASAKAVFTPVTFIEPDGSIHEFASDHSDFMPRHDVSEPVEIKAENPKVVLADTQRIYDEFIAALKQKGLDKRLALEFD